MESSQARREKLAQLRLYLITGDRGDEQETVRIVAAALEGGVDAVQLRKKTSAAAEQYAIGLALRRLTALHQALLIINDHADLAIAVDADGVHLGQDDLPPEAVRSLPGFEGRLIGRSTHSLAQARQAMQEGADYFAVGPIFATPTKAGTPPVGTTLITEVAAIADRPWLAVGGLDRDNAAGVVAAGAPALAVVRAIYEDEDAAEAARRLRALTLTRLEAARR
jgi:thiamine-phosphate pyrophosphorylase